MIADNRGYTNKFMANFFCCHGFTQQFWRQQSSHGRYLREVFADKVAAVRADTEAAPTPEIKNTATDHLSSWTHVTASEVEKMIGLAAN